MIVAMIASVVLVIATILILYETLRLTSNHLAELPLPPRARIIVVVLAAFVGHTLAVWTYAFAYWGLAHRIGGFAGLPVNDFTDCLYFSAVTYTSLGFGDHVPVSHVRLIAGVEGLNGLLLIGWSASFTYLAMERYWPMHDRRMHDARRTVRQRRGGGGGRPARGGQSAMRERTVSKVSTSPNKASTSPKAHAD